MRPQPERAWHNIRPNETTKIPRQHIFLDTEARTARRGKIGTQTWRLAVAEFHKGAKGRATRSESRDFRDPNKLWRDVSDFAGSQGRTVLWAHNLGYDIRISQMFIHLPALGWRLTGHNITARSTWLEWKRGKDTLLMVDSVTVFNTTIVQMGVWHGIGKPPMELDSDNERDWYARCRADVRILSTSVTAYLDWLERSDMGNWQITGAAQSWATFRHKHLTHKLVVHNEPGILAAERTAMWTGRCEAYWRGQLKGERVYEWDFKAAYPTIARDYSLPCKLLGPMPNGYNWHKLLGSERTAILGVVQIDTDVPVVPTRMDGRILWPTGTFTTTLWDVEIKAALDAGARVRMLDAWLYRKQPILKQWGTWILDQLAQPDDIVLAWQKAILKHHSRALIGRFAMTYNQWEEWGETATSDVMRGTVWDRDKDETYEVMQVGTTVWQDMGRVEWQNSMPMITGYVQAIGRIHLWDIMQQLPPRSLIYVDTDSILCTGQHVDAITKIAASFEAGQLRLKRAWDGFAVYGPRQVVTGEQVRVSGIPRIAEQTGPNHYSGEVWDSLIGSIRNGTLDTVVTRDREWTIKGVDNRRRGTGFGWTEPIRVDT